MIPDWPRKSPHAEAARRLHDAIDMAVIQAAVDNLAASMHNVATVNMAPDQVSNTHATNIRDDLAALLDERAQP